MVDCNVESICLNGTFQEYEEKCESECNECMEYSNFNPIDNED